MKELQKESASKMTLERKSEEMNINSLFFQKLFAKTIS